jgi:hypothetical protein
MSLWLRTEGRTCVAVAVCDRCKMKRYADFLVPDPNAPGLRVCGDTCVDVLDPWRLAPRTTEDITVKGVRPEVALINSGMGDPHVAIPGRFIPGQAYPSTL